MCTVPASCPANTGQTDRLLYHDTNYDKAGRCDKWMNWWCVIESVTVYLHKMILCIKISYNMSNKFRQTVGSPKKLFYINSVSRSLSLFFWWRLWRLKYTTEVFEVYEKINKQYINERYKDFEIVYIFDWFGILLLKRRHPFLYNYGKNSEILFVVSHMVNSILSD